MQSIN
jgi:hypothetical protein